MPRPGDVLAGRFRIERSVGVGGMGGVFAAEDLQMGAPVALKVMLPHLMEVPEFAGRFMREAKTASSLTSPHVAQVFDIGVSPDEGTPFIVMELLQGEDLDHVLRSGGPLPISQAVGYVIEACHAVAEAHAQGIVHRDLKPSNLFLAKMPDGRSIVKVLDFGISKSTKLDGSGPQEQLTATDSALGSPIYMSPEQLRSAKKVDQRTDIWSLGIILHKLLTGSLAFEAESMGQHFAMIIADPPTPLRARRPDAPAKLEEVVLRCLQKDLSLRYQNLGQLSLALVGFVGEGARPLVESIIAMTGREASFAPLPPLPGQAPAPAPVPAPLPPSGQRTVQVPIMVSAPTPAPVVQPVVIAQPVAIAQPVPIVPPMRPMLPSSPTGAPQVSPVIPVAPASSGRSLRAAAIGVGVVVVGLAAFLVTQIARSSATAAPAASASVAPASTPVAAASTTARVPASAPPPAAPAEVVITLQLDPKDAEIELDGAIVHTSLLRLAKGDTTHKLVIRAPGYAPETRDVHAAMDATLPITLHKTGPVPGRKTKVPLETSL